MPRPRILHVTDPHYAARGREYAGEDVYLGGRLAGSFDVERCLPTEAADRMAGFDVVLVRNSGPVAGYREAHARFRERALATGQRVYNELTGKGDMLGKQHLLDLHREGFPVIPSVGSAAEIDLLPPSSRYVVKPLLGADSAGQVIATAEEIHAAAPTDVVIQPMLDIAHEVSFYVVDRTLVYALHTPDPRQRWALEPYEVSGEDEAFARRFVEWNDIEHGLQRVDAARTTDGRLLLVELEDLNPYLSLDRATPEGREALVRELTAALTRLAES